MFAQPAPYLPDPASPPMADGGAWPPSLQDAVVNPLLAAADLQDHLMVASNDLERLQRLLDDASQALMGHFTLASGHIEAGALKEARLIIGGAITALQFQDMASQLIAHTTRRLRSCADRIARDAMGDDEDGTTLVEAEPLRPNPVTQDEMDAGSIELF